MTTKGSQDSLNPKTYIIKDWGNGGGIVRKMSYQAAKNKAALDKLIKRCFRESKKMENELKEMDY
jgi:hypothetical protein